MIDRETTCNIRADLLKTLDVVFSVRGGFVSTVAEVLR